MASIAPANRVEGVLRKDRLVVTVILLAVVTASWVHLLAGAGTGMYPQDMAALVPDLKSMMMSPISWTPDYALLMFWMWWLMMIAMMLPSAAPLVLLHSAITRKQLTRGNSKQTTDQIYASTVALIGGYLMTWGAFSLVAVTAQWILEHNALLTAMMVPTSKVLGSVLLLAAGIWQFTPLKARCLLYCRSPIHFLSTCWLPGTGGAFRNGLQHGVYCLGCCWFLMTLLFFGGIMNLAWIICLALFVLLEKILPAGVVFGRVTGLLLITWGAWLGFTSF